jgi:hypothetical protein
LDRECAAPAAVIRALFLLVHGPELLCVAFIKVSSFSVTRSRTDCSAHATSPLLASTVDRRRTQSRSD